LEVVRVVFDKAKLSYKDVIKYFFEIHDPTQADGQGPDLGEQYLSAIFYYDEEQLAVAKIFIVELEELGYAVVTTLKPVKIFWPAEAYHQNYYSVNNKLPYCHVWQDRFKAK
jgi:peptide methionine sulfoxide reductase msrA/msrB